MGTTTMQAAAAERVHYFPRQLLTADDMLAEQEYFRERLRRHNRYLHGWGIVCGCSVQAADPERPWVVTVCPGYLITPAGDEIQIPSPGVEFDMAADRIKAPADPCAGWSSPGGGLRKAGEETTVYLAACYRECNTRPVRIHPAGCGCDDAACEYSRTRDSFAIVRLDDPPESATAAAKADGDWLDLIKGLLEKRVKPGEATGREAVALPERACPEFFDDNCVVLAAIRLPATTSQPLAIDRRVRRPLPTVQALSQVVAELAQYRR